MSDNIGDFTIGIDVSEFTSAMGKAEDSADDLQASLDKTKSVLEELETQQESTAAAFAQEVSAEYEKLEEQADSANTSLSDLEGTADALGGSLEGAGEGAEEASDGLDDARGSSSGLGDAFSSLSSKAGALGGVIGGLVGGGISGLIDIIPQLTEKVIEVAMSFDQANSILVEKTGASGEALAEFNEIAKDTAIALDGLDVTGTAGVVGELNTRLDLTGVELQKATMLIGHFADVTGTDAEQAVKSINGVMKTWGVEASDMESLLDKLVVAGQKSGVSVDELANSLGDNKYLLEQMGLSLDDSIGLLANFEKNNIKSTTAMFGFRSAISKWSKEGKSAEKGFADLTNSIKNSTSAQEGNNKAIEYFGTRAGPMIADAIRDGRWEFDYMTEAIVASNGALADTEARSDTMADKAEQLGDALGIVAFGGDSLQDTFSKVTENADMMNISVGDAILQYLGLQEAQQSVLETSPELAEAEAQEAERLQKQAEMEQLASNGYDTMSKNMDSIGAKIEDLNQQYTENYDVAYKSIDGSIGLFDDMTIKSGKSVNKMIDSLKSQVKYMDNYSSNMKRAAELGIDQGLLAKLSDGSEESAAILQSIVDDGGEHIEELNTELAKVEEGKKSFSDTYAQMATDFDTKMTQIEKRVELAEDSLDAYEDMYKDGANSVQGFINGANSKLESVKRTFKNLADTGKREIQKGYDMHSPSKVMEKYGENVTEGFAEGVLKELDTVQNAFAQIARAPINMPDVSVPASQPNSSIVVNVPIQVSRQMTDADIARKADMITNIVSKKFAEATGGSLS